MSVIKRKINIMDIIIMVLLLLIVLSSIIQTFAVSKFEKNNKIMNAVITLRITDCDSKTAEEIISGDLIYCEDIFGDKPLGKVTGDPVKYSVKPDIVVPGGSIAEYEIKVSTSCLVNSDGFCSVNDEIITPGMVFNADDAYVSFTCKVMSVKLDD